MKIFIILALIAVALGASAQKVASKKETATKAPATTTTKSQADIDAAAQKLSKLYEEFNAKRLKRYEECVQKYQNTRRAMDCEAIKKSRSG